MITLDTKIAKLKTRIKSKQLEVDELSDSVAFLNQPPKYEIAKGQLPFFEQVRSLMTTQKDEDENRAALKAAQSVLEAAQSELLALQNELSKLESERDCGLAIAEIKQAVADYNSAAVAFLKQSEALQECSRKHGTTLHRAGYSVSFFTSGMRSSFRVAVATENGSVYTRQLLDLTAQQRSELGL